MSCRTPTPRQRRLDHLLEAGAALTLMSVTLLYLPIFSDNFLVKSAVGTSLSLLLGMLWLVRHWTGLTWPRTPLYIPFGAYLLFTAIAVGAARNPWRAVEVWLGYLGWLALFVVGAHLAGDMARLRRLVRVVLLTGVAVAVTGFLQYNGIDPLDLPARYRGLPVATLGNTNFVAHYLDLLLPLAAVLLLPGALARRDRWLAAATLAAAGVLLLLTGSRGGWVSVAAAAVVVVVTVASRPRRWLPRFGLVLLCLGLLSPVAQTFLRSVPVGDSGQRTAEDVVEELADQVWARGVSIFDEADFSRSMRVLIWRDAWRMARQHWLTGVGPGQWGTELPAYRTATSHRDWRGLIGLRQNQPYYAHQEYLQEWGESGLPGALALAGLLGVVLGWTWRQVRRRTGKEDAAAGAALRRAVALGGLGAVVAAGVHALFSFNLRDAVVTAHLWLLCGWVAGTGVGWGTWAWSGWRRAAVLLAAAGISLTSLWLAAGALMGEAFYFRGLRYAEQGQGNRAILALRQAVDWRDHDFRLLHWLGKVNLEMGRPQEAFAALERSLQLHAHNAAALRLQTRAALELGRSEAAVRAARRAVSIDPLTIDNYLLLAEAQRLAGDREAAVTAWRQALSFRPDDVGLLISLAFDLRLAGHPQDGITVLERALKAGSSGQADARRGLVHGNLGALYLQIGQYGKAETHLRRALQLDRDNAATWAVNLVTTLMRLQRWPEARQEAETALEAAPDDERLRALFRTLETR